MGGGASYTRPAGDPHDWAAVCRWEDAGRPPIILTDEPAEADES